LKLIFLSFFYFVFFENPTLPSNSILMSSGIDNFGTGEASGKKSKKPKKNKIGQISSLGPSVEQQSVSVPRENRQETITSQSSNRILPEQTSIAILTSTHSKVGDTILSPGQSSADLMIAGVQELHSSTFDATTMQTDPSDRRNQLRSEKVSAHRKSTLDQRYLSKIQTNQHQTAQESLQDPSATGRHGEDTNLDEFEVDDN
jgi:hypothetical protein